MRRVLITRKLFPEALALLEDQGVAYEMNEGPPLPKRELLRKVAGVDGLICLLSDRIDREVLEAGKALRVVANVAVGYDNIDVQAASELGIMVTNTPEVLTEATADLTFGLILAVARRIVEGDRLVREGGFKGWELDLLLGAEVHHKTLGIVGFGRIGQAVARRARGFGMEVLYYDPIRRPELERELGAQFVQLKELLSRSDFVSLHLPLTPQTRHLIGREELGLMKPSAFLINVARGPIVDEAALVEALKSGELAGAGLDVFEHEPDVHPELLRMSNVVLTPHIGSAGRETRLRMALMAVENVLAALAGRRPPNLVNPEVWP
ncbi:MAG: D-glycerate dehydrogenase [Candidatus Acetothermia bacterium]|jgi:glyoxylate reductase|nr:D-glycerate dehydrogenase [Candidatus Acetothermia bacterium]MDH7505362.1 D-glycerate dehydrogenase [Candidatus Acetothermia bacterium]